MWLALRRHVSKTSIRLGMLGIVLMGAAASCAVKEPSVIQGTWVITDAITPGYSASQTGEAQSWLGQSLRYEQNALMLGQTSCRNPQYQENKTSAETFRQQYKVELKALDIYDDSVHAVNVSCDKQSSVPGQTVFLTASGDAFTVWDGVFYKMEKTPPKTQADGL